MGLDCKKMQEFCKIYPNLRNIKARKISRMWGNLDINILRRVCGNFKNMLNHIAIYFIWIRSFIFSKEKTALRISEIVK